MSKQYRIRVQDKTATLLAATAKEKSITVPELAALIIHDHMEGKEKQDLIEFNLAFDFKVDIYNSNNKVRRLAITLQEGDIDSLDQLAEYYNISKSKCISKLIRMYINREVTTLSYQVGLIESLTKTLMQLRGLGTNTNQIAIVLNKWLKESNYKEEPYPLEAREFIKGHKLRYKRIKECIESIEKAIKFGSFL